MKPKKRKKISQEIRIGRPDVIVYETVKKLAEKEDRTIAGQANKMLHDFITQNNLL
jgi:hypothetical protein